MPNEEATAAERETDDEQRAADLDLIFGGEQVLGGEGPIDGGLGQRTAFDLDHGDVDGAGCVAALAPDAPPVAVQGNGKAGRLRHVDRIRMEFDFQAVGKVFAWVILDDMPAGDQKQALIAREEEAAGIGQQALAFESADAGGGEQQGFDH